MKIIPFNKYQGAWIYVRTFDKGAVEETISFDTCITASAILSVLTRHFGTNIISVSTLDGDRYTVLSQSEPAVKKNPLLLPCFQSYKVFQFILIRN